MDIEIRDTLAHMVLDTIMLISLPIILVGTLTWELLDRLWHGR